MANDTFMQSNGVLVWLEFDDSGRLTPLSLELAAQARRLAVQSRGPAWGIVLSEEDNIDGYCSLVSDLDLDRIIIYGGLGPDFRAHVFAEALSDCISTYCPSVVLAGSSDRGKDVAPMAAANFQTGLTADCIRLEMLDDGNLLQVRPAFGGNIMAEIVTPQARPQFATVRPGAFKVLTSENSSPPEIIKRFKPATPDKLTVIERRKISKTSNLANAKIVVALGCGFKAAEDIRPVHDWAIEAGAELGATRSLVERGWMPPESQIGLSGNSIAPKLLVTLGISGSVQFLAGIGGAGHIIAVNNDFSAPIFAVANQGLCVDLYEVLPFLEKITVQ